jgi:hypothetical protein
MKIGKVAVLVALADGGVAAPISEADVREQSETTQVTGNDGPVERSAPAAQSDARSPLGPIEDRDAGKAAKLHLDPDLWDWIWDGLGRGRGGDRGGRGGRGGGGRGRGRGR